MKLNSLVIVAAMSALVLGSNPSSADPKKGAKNFRQCMACHSIKEGENRVGPSLYHVFGRKAGVYPKYRYSKGMKAASAKGLVWTRENLIAYLENPNGFLKKYLGVSSVQNKMPMKFPKMEFRKDVVDYLESQKKQ